MSSQGSRPHETHDTMAKVLQAQRRDPDGGISNRGDIGAAKQARGKQAYLKGGVGAAVGSSSVTADSSGPALGRIVVR